MANDDDTDTATQDERIGRLETGHDTLNEKLDLVLSKLTGKTGRQDDPQSGGGAPGGRPDIAEQVRLELERKDAESKARADADAEKSDRETIKDQLAKLREAAPRPPQRKSERVMWGSR